MSDIVRRAPLFVPLCALLLPTLVGCGAGEAFVEELPPGDLYTLTAEEQALRSEMPPCGTVLAEFEGTPAYSNGTGTSTGNSCAGVGRYGLQYQCVELANRHVITRYGAPRIWANAKDLPEYAPRKHYDVYLNGDGAHPPVPGDMLVWKNGTYGHVALVTAVRATSIDLIEQNWPGSGRVTLVLDNGWIGARSNGWVPYGWIHAKANVRQAPDDDAPEVDAGSPETPDAGAPSEPTDAGTPQAPDIDWSCAQSQYNGAQLWTCHQGDRYRCEAQTPVKDACEAGCYAQSLGQNDLCMSAGTGWSCMASQYRGQQLWTCAGDSLFKCEGGVPKRVDCPKGCSIQPLGANDRCKP